MSTSAYVDSETITQADGAQSSRVPVPLPDEPNVAVRQAQLVNTDTESDPEEAPSETKESQLLGSRVPLMSEEFEASELSGTRTVSSHSLVSSDSTAPLSPDRLLTHVSPTPTPTLVSFHRRTTRMAVRTQPTLSPGMSGRIAEATALSPSSLSYYTDAYGQNLIDEFYMKRFDDKAYLFSKSDFKSCVLWERVHDFHLGIESYYIKVNLTAPTINFPSIETLPLYSIIADLFVGIIYENSKKQKRAMNVDELQKFSDATLKRVLRKISAINVKARHGFKTLL
ncbi:hypothetical protein Tco_1351979 [Tanacetum coccineum]